MGVVLGNKLMECSWDLLGGRPYGA